MEKQGVERSEVKTLSFNVNAKYEWEVRYDEGLLLFKMYNMQEGVEMVG